MKRIPSRGLYFFVTSAVLLSASVASAALAQPLPKPSSQEDFPVLRDSPFACYIDLPFPQYVNGSGLIVDATVKRVIPENGIYQT